MSSIPGLGLVKGMALTMRRFFQPPVTIKYPEVDPDIAVKYRGRLQLLYDEHGTLKCETCFQCAQACPIECIDMGGRDTKGRYAVHWGAAETYGERRTELALRRAGREVPDELYEHFEPVDLAAIDAILEAHDHDPHRMLSILEAVQAEFGHLPVAALKRISHRTGAWYAMIYGTASYYHHLRLRAGREGSRRLPLPGLPHGRRRSARGLDRRRAPGGAGPAHARRADPLRLAARRTCPVPRRRWWCSTASRSRR